MEKSEIKKALYKEKPIAKYNGTKNSLSYPVISSDGYATKLNDGTDVFFLVPHKEMGENHFEKEMPAQLLIRWMV